MSNPVLVEVTRGALVESRHRGAVAVVDADGATRARARRCRAAGVSALGGEADPGAAADRERRGGQIRFRRPGTGARLCVSWRRAGACRGREPDAGGAPGSMSRRSNAARNGRAIGLDRRRLRARAERRSALHNNCSGKHAGFLCVACAQGLDHRGYVGVGASGAARGARRDRGSDAALHCRRIACGIDGCAIPTWAVPLTRWRTRSRGSAPGRGSAPERAKAAARLRAACAAQPYFVAGTGRFCTEIMKLFGARVLGEDRRRGRVLRRAARAGASASRSNATMAARARPKSRWRP